MKQSEAKNIFIELTNERLETLGFKLKKTRTSEAIYIRNKENGFERIGISTTNYYPEVVFGMGNSKRINLIEDLLYQINQHLNLGLNLNKETVTLTYKGNINERRLKLLEVEHKDDERGVIESTKILMHFIENDLLSTYDLFDDIREIDKRINGEGENWGVENKPFSIDPYVPQRRFIMARLCKSDDAFEKFTNTFFNEVDEKMIAQGEPIINRNDENLWIVKFIDYLRKNVKPIY